ncbi:MAG: spermidine synthase, partial [Trebonia sp.]
MIAFARRPPIGHRTALTLQPVAVLPALLLFFWGLNEAIWWVMALHFCAFFLTALVCHGELARTRPDSRHLTEFYLLLSLGGVLGGMFNALLAPMVFTTTVEYPLVMTAALLLRPLSGPDSRHARLLDLAVPAAWFVAMMLFARVTQKEVTEDDLALISTVSLVLALVCFLAVARPIRFGLLVTAIVAAGWIMPQFTEDVIFANRNFYGILRVVDDEDDNMRTIYHGTTQHGAQMQTPSLRLKPITYYVAGSPVAQLFGDTTKRHADANIAVLGLGAGTVACLAGKGERVTFYEIDPAVESVARDPKLFTFLRDCPPRLDLVLGDGRLTMTRAPDHGYDLIVLDAFTSDAVPMHLLTSEAARLYRAKLKDDGIVVFNISNRYLDLAPE